MEIIRKKLHKFALLIYVKIPKIHPLRRSYFESRANEENTIRRESDDIIEELPLNIDNLQHIAGLGPKEMSLVYYEKLLFLRSPKQPPRGREQTTGGNSTFAQISQGFDSLHDRGSLHRVCLGLETSILVSDEV